MDMNIDTQKLIRTRLVQKYFMERHNPDGGFTLVPPLESSIEDTYYALYSLNILGYNGITLEKTLSFIQNYPISSLRVAYFALKTLKLLAQGLSTQVLQPNLTNLREKLVNVALIAPIRGANSVNIVETIGRKTRSNKDTKHFEESLEKVRKNLPFKSIDLERLTLFEMPTKLEEIHYQIYVLKELGFSFDRENFIHKILSYKNPDGGFGARNNSNIEETHYAIMALSELSYPTNRIQDTINWLRRCENEDGSFRINPHTIIEPSLDYIYFGVNALLTVDETPHYRTQILKIIRQFQNGNGGFRRSIRFGVSKPEYTYYALKIINNLMHS